MFLLALPNHHSSHGIRSPAEFSVTGRQGIVAVTLVRDALHRRFQPGDLHVVTGPADTGGLEYRHRVPIGLTTGAVEENELCILLPCFAQQYQGFLQPQTFSPFHNQRALRLQGKFPAEELRSPDQFVFQFFGFCERGRALCRTGQHPDITSTGRAGLRQCPGQISDTGNA